jgi:AcrR family transcriptional regulator
VSKTESTTFREGLRERKKRLMRRQLSDTAMRMFLQRGFDAVRVAEVAEACAVSEKTVFNYFPTKEALVLDRLEETMPALRNVLADRATNPIDAALRILSQELDHVLASLRSAHDLATAMTTYQRFGDLIRTTPSLRAHRNDMTDRFVAVAAELLADRAELRFDDPEPQIAAAALLGLWRVQFHSLRRHMRADSTLNQIHQAVTTDVRRAAALLKVGLPSFGRP